MQGQPPRSSERRECHWAVHSDRPISSGPERPIGAAGVSEELGESLDGTLWPEVREKMLQTMRHHIDAEVSRARALLEQEYAQKRSDVEAQESLLRCARQELQGHQQALEDERQAFELEKASMAAGTLMTDILTLNIGGEKVVAVQRGTLCAVQDSMLASSFSGRWDDRLARDKEGAFFVDFDPGLFMPLLNYMRARRIEDPAEPTAPATAPGREDEFKAMLKYYGLEDVAGPPPSSSAQSLNFTFATTAAPHGVEITESCLLATRTSSSHWRRAFGLVRVNRAELTHSVSLKFQIVAFGNFMLPDDFVMANRGEQPGGPNIGLAAAELTRADDQSDTRKGDCIWGYRPRDGALLAPCPEDVVGVARRSPAIENDTVTITLHKDGRVSLSINDKDQGLIFQNVPTVVKPLVEMNTNNCKVRIVGSENMLQPGVVSQPGVIPQGAHARV